MAEVTVLVEGFYKEDNKGKYDVCATVSLVRDGKNIIVIDPGTLASQDILTEALKKEGLSVNDVTMVGLTHSHIDHFRNTGMFPSAIVLEYWGLWDGVKWSTASEYFSEDIEVVKTPGHDYSCLTFFVKTKEGIVAICGDVFFSDHHPKEDPFATDKKALEKSRKLIMEKADFIIPGHGAMYKTNRIK